MHIDRLRCGPGLLDGVPFINEFGYDLRHHSIYRLPVLERAYERRRLVVVPALGRAETHHLSLQEVSSSKPGYEGTLEPDGIYLIYFERSIVQPDHAAFDVDRVLYAVYFVIIIVEQLHQHRDHSRTEEHEQRNDQSCVHAPSDHHGVGLHYADSQEEGPDDRGDRRLGQNGMQDYVLVRYAHHRRYHVVFGVGIEIAAVHLP